MNVRDKLPANSLNFLGPRIAEIVFVLIKFEPRVLKNERKLLWLGKQNFIDRVVLDFQSQ